MLIVQFKSIDGYPATMLQCYNVCIKAYNSNQIYIKVCIIFTFSDIQCKMNGNKPK